MKKPSACAPAGKLPLVLSCGTLRSTSNGEALLGTPLIPYIRLLREQELLPLTTLLSIGTNSPHYNEDDKSGIFYGQSWALVHYLMLGDRGHQGQFKRFLNHVSRGDNSGKALEETFGVSLAVTQPCLTRIRVDMINRIGRILLRRVLVLSCSSC